MLHARPPRGPRETLEGRNLPDGCPIRASPVTLTELVDCRKIEWRALDSGQ